MSLYGEFKHDYRLNIEIPGLPKTTNAQMGMHWREKGRAAKLWHTKVFAAICGNIPIAPLKKASVTCVRYSSKCPDYDGLVSSFKHPIDALIKCKIIEDDNMDVIGMPQFSWCKTKPKDGHIQIMVHEI